MQPAAPPLDVTPEELEALLEGVREALGEAGYQKLKAAIRTLSYVTQLLETRGDFTDPAPAVVPCTEREDQGRAGASGHRGRPDETEAGGGGLEESGRWARAQRSGSLSWSTPGRGAACVLAPRGSVPGVSARQGVPAA